MRYAELHSLGAYKASLAGVAPLSREAERELARKFLKGDRRAGDKLVAACLPFVISIALEYRRWGVPIEDIIQQGNLGLLRAAKKFDPDRECRLATYASYWIRAEIREYVVRTFRVVRLGTTKSERRALRAYRAGESNVEKLAEISGLSPERVEQILPLLSARETSLDARMADGSAAEDHVASNYASPEDEASDSERASQATKVVGDALVVLSDRERMIVKARMMTDDPPTLKTLGEKLGVSKERVRQIEERAKAKLRDKLNGFPAFVPAA